MYQNVVIVGHLGKDPEVRYLPSGTPTANFPVATNRRWTDNEGNNHDETTWFRVSVFGRQAEVCSQFLEKGRLVLVEGDIRTGQYDDPQGVTRYTWELRANVVKFLGSAGERGPMPSFEGHMNGDVAQGASSPAGAHAPSGGVAEEDIPF